MKQLTRLVVILLVFLTFTSIASAARTVPGPFTTIATSSQALDVGPLPDGYQKFHLSNQGTVSGYFQGEFANEEWGIADSVYSGAHHAVMTVSTPTGRADLIYGAVFNIMSVSGSFMFRGGTGDYEGIRGEGTKAGNTGFLDPPSVVIYTPCGGKDQPVCPADRCAVFGGDLKVKKDKAQWTISNEGEQSITIGKITVFWPSDGPQLTQVKLAGKAIFTQPLLAPVATIDGGWIGDAKDREIKAGQQRDLWLEFGGRDVSPNPWDYTILVEFEGGCAVPFVAFPPTGQ